MTNPERNQGYYANKQEVEPILKPEIKITAESLIADNSSPLAYVNRVKNQEAVEKGETDLTFACSDARLIIPNLIQAFIVNAISTGGNRNEFMRLINSKGRGIINLAHFALLPGEASMLPVSKLKGCGGLTVKEALEQDLLSDYSNNSAARFVRDEVEHSDPLVQTALAAQKVAELCDTGKPIAAAAQNHLTGEIGILAVFRNVNKKINALYKPNFDPALIRPETYDAKKIYENGIPFLDPETLPEEFETIYNYLKNQNEKMERMKKWYPDLFERQKVQNKVRALLWTTSARPPHLRFPTLFREPGSLFTVSQARTKDIIFEGNYALQRVKVTANAMLQGLSQIHYPLSEAIAHIDQSDKAFHGLNTLIIEASDMETAMQMQGKFLQTNWGKDFLQKVPNAQIIILETQGGIIRQSGEFRLYANA